MVEFNKVSVKLSNSQLNKLKTAAGNETGTTLRISVKIFHENNSPRELLLTTRRTTKLRNTIDNNMPTGIKLPNTQISKIIQSGEFLPALFSNIAGPLMKVAVPLAKNILATLGITAAGGAIDAEIQKNIYGSGTTTLRVSNEAMDDIIKIVQALEYSKVLLKGITERRIFGNIVR